MEITTSGAATKGERLVCKISLVFSAQDQASCFFDCSDLSSRLQRPNVYLPVHLYGQLVHDKTGCHLLEAQVTTAAFTLFPAHIFLLLRRISSLGTGLFPQSVVPDLSYTVRSPMLDTWEGIKQLKAALWALVSSTLSSLCPRRLHFELSADLDVSLMFLCH